MKISFPAMKGNMGKRDFYVAMIKLSLIPKIFSYHDWAELPPEQRAQRVLQKSRIPEITQYILDNEEGYLFSSLTASYDGEEVFKPSVESPELGILELPLDSQFTMNDGQHRMAAIVEALKQNPILANETISVVFFPYEDLDRMQQMFSDLNRTVKVTSKSLNILYDHKDLLGQLVLDAVEKVSVFRNMVDKDRVSLPLRSPKLFTLSAVYDASKELVGVVTLENQDEKAGIINNYWEAVGANIRQWKQVQKGELRPSELRFEYVHSHAVVLWGIGAMGKTVIQEYPTDWQSKLARLSDIDWRRTNKEWQGVCMQGTDIVNRRQSRKDTASFLKNKMGQSPVKSLVINPDINIEDSNNNLPQATQTITSLPPVATTTSQWRPMGRRGNEQLTDYLIPVIRLIKSGVKHPDAFRRIADNLHVRQQTAQAECTVQLDHISTEKFVELIKSNQIKSFLKEKFPDKASLIEKEL